jgi:pyrimidine deaminase RibD-like protein
MSLLGCLMEGCVTYARDSTCDGTMLQQEPDHVHLAKVTCNMKGSVPSLENKLKIAIEFTQSTLKYLKMEHQLTFVVESTFAPFLTSI